jgi:putative tryptophan/tyrosine transport system substrate-binding protein
MTTRRAVLGTAAVVLAPRAFAIRQSGKVARIGVLRVGPPPASFIEPFRQALRELGHVEGQTITIEYASAGSVAQLAETAAELVRRKVDVVLASGTPSVLPARNATRTIPVVFVAAIDPVAVGVVASLARPGGNVTGVSAVHGDAMAKRLQLLKELLPTASRVGFLVRATSPATPQYLQEAELAARALGMQLQVLRVREAGDIEAAFGVAQGASAVLQVDDAMLTSARKLIADLALKHRLPTVSGLRETVEAGGLMSYGPHYADLYRRAAAQVHKILNGAKPADLPVEQATLFELTINLGTAKAIGLSIPQSLLARADQVIE